MGSYPTQGLLLYNDNHTSLKYDEANNEVGKEIGFGKACDSDFPASGQAWLQL